MGQNANGALAVVHHYLPRLGHDKGPPMAQWSRWARQWDRWEWLGLVSNYHPSLFAIADGSWLAVWHAYDGLGGNVDSENLLVDEIE